MPKTASIYHFVDKIYKQTTGLHSASLRQRVALKQLATVDW